MIHAPYIAAFISAVSPPPLPEYGSQIWVISDPWTCLVVTPSLTLSLSSFPKHYMVSDCGMCFVIIQCTLCYAVCNVHSCPVLSALLFHTPHSAPSFRSLAVLCSVSSITSPWVSLPLPYPMYSYSVLIVMMSQSSALDDLIIAICVILCSVTRTDRNMGLLG